MPSARTTITTYRQVMALWPSQSAFARDLDITFSFAGLWRREGRIPSDRWDGVVAAARRRAISGITRALLARLPSADGVGSIQELIALWPGRIHIARDLGISDSTVRSWAKRNRVPIEYWPDLIASARHHGIQHLTNSRLQNIALASLPTRPRRVQRWPLKRGVTDAHRVVQARAKTTAADNSMTPMLATGE
jgi:hypothetical protein